MHHVKLRKAQEMLNSSNPKSCKICNSCWSTSVHLWMKYACDVSLMNYAHHACIVYDQHVYVGAVWHGHDKLCTCWNEIHEVGSVSFVIHFLLFKRICAIWYIQLTICFGQCFKPCSSHYLSLLHYFTGVNKKCYKRITNIIIN